MCGICGTIGFVDRDLLGAMCRAMSHRGPDDEGIYIDGTIGLGIRRLKIIDLDTGNQPIHNEDKSIWIVFNGEVYNYQELRDSLEKKGHRFYTRTDTEIIVHLYEEKGEDCVADLNGMFAFALWDKAKEKLFIARDRLGVKPLYYSIHNGNLLFASELKALLEYEGIRREVEPEALHAYMTFLYIPAPLSILRGVKKLLAGHTLTYHKGAITERQYWDLNIAKNKTTDENYYCESIYSLLKDAVKIRLISDVPLGVFLSGGMDSSTIVGLMSQLSHQPIKTFSIGYGARDSSYNELEYSRVIAKHFNTDHHEFIVEPDLLRSLPKLAWHLDEPFADSSAVPTYLVSEVARSHITVALSGIGGDESFAGYPRYIGAAYSQYYQAIPVPIKRFLSALTDTLPESTKSRNLARWAKRFTRGGLMEPMKRYIGWVSYVRQEQKSSLYSPSMMRALENTDAHRIHLDYAGKVAAGAYLDQISYLDIKTYLADDLLFMGDRMSMAHSLELRAPFCDYRIMELSASIPYELKLKGYNLKYLLKKAVSGVVPKDILTRKKQGFMIPIGQWLKGELKEWVLELLSEANVKKRGYFKYEHIKWVLAQHFSGKQNFDDHIWSLLMLEIWHQVYIDKKYDFSQDRHTARPRTRRLNIVTVADFVFQDDKGGSGRVVTELSKGLSERGHSVSILSRNISSKAPANEEIEGIRVYRYSAATQQPLRYLVSCVKNSRVCLNQIIHEKSPDVVICHHPLPALCSVFSKRLMSVPRVYMFHSSWPKEYKIKTSKGGFNVFFRRLIEKKVLQSADKIIVLSEFSKREILDLYPGEQQKIEIIPGGVDTEKFKPSHQRSALREKLNLPHEKTILITVRGLTSRMGLENLIESMRIITKETQNVLLIIGGGGFLESKLKRLVKEFKLEHYIRFTGFIEEQLLLMYYQAADIFVLPTLHLEGFGLVTLEALSCGTPVLGTPVGGTIEILNKFDPAFLFKDTQPDSMAELIAKFIGEYKNNSDEIRRKCREFILNNYSWEKMASHTERLLLELCKNKL